MTTRIAEEVRKGKDGQAVITFARGRRTLGTIQVCFTAGGACSPSPRGGHSHFISRPFSRCGKSCVGAGARCISSLT